MFLSAPPDASSACKKEPTPRLERRRPRPPPSDTLAYGQDERFLPWDPSPDAP